ncbi:SIR2 family protein [Promicromonospora sp. NPDC060204]|uniref:SIR2 family protein n=1 Tax=Promicromonospora sp. NPDC060204 TaxID=3347071 RepID=UPI00365D4E75
MHFAGMNVPDELVQAHADGRVVFFVGAGASRGAPTSLPLFSELTCRIADLVGAARPNEKQLAQPDVYLGGLDADEDVDVHAHVASEIALGRRRNRMHDALASLAAAPGVIRLVTTNFDNFLGTALKAQGHKFAIHKAPSIPLGDDFEGVVHLHGHVHEPRRLIVTDADFGTAYITKGWASTFLRALFAEFTVCFVGYSHEDRMMDYFARGLSAAAQPRFIFTDRTDVLRWRTLGITPITYDKGAHHVLGNALADWGAWSSSSLFGRAQRIRAFQGGAPPSDPDDADFLASALTDQSLVDEVCAIARGEDWVTWMAAQAPLKSLVGSSTILQLDDQCLVSLARWMAREGTDPECWRLVYDLVRAGERVHSRLTEAILQRLDDREVDVEIHSGWLRWVLSTDLAGSEGWRIHLEFLWSSDVVLSDHDTILLLDKVVDSWSAPGANSFGRSRGSDLLIEEWHLKDGINRRMLGKDARFRRATLAWATSFFERAHRLVAIADSSLDTWNFARSTIDGENEPGLHDAADVLIDLARDVLEAHRAEEPADASLFRSIWLISEAPLLRRIALHSMRFDPGMQTSEKLDLLLERGRLFDRDIRHEAYMLLSDVVPSLGPDAVESLVEAVVTRISHDDELAGDERWASDARDYQGFVLLEGILRGSPTTERPAVLGEIAARHPDWHTDGSLDLTSRAMSGSEGIEESWPWQPAEFHDMLEKDARAALGQFAQEPRVDEWHGWWGAGDMLTHTVVQWPDDGVSIWGLTDDAGIRASVVDGWSKAELDEDRLQEIGRLISKVDLDGMAHSVMRLLLPWSNDAEHRRRWAARADGRNLARRVFPYVASEQSGMSGGDLMSRAINTPVGQLAEYWAGVAIDEARAGVYPGGLLSEEVRSALEELLDRSAGRQYVEAVLLRNLLFFYRADPTWARGRLLALIDPAGGSWDDLEQAWQVVLKGQWGEDLLEAGVRDWIVKCSEHTAPNSALSRDLPRWIASIAISSTMADAGRLDWLSRVVAAGGIDLRVSWAEEFGRRFADSDLESRLTLWRRWIREYVRRRVSSVPRVLAPSELTALVTLVAGLPAGTELTEGMNLLSKAPCGLAPAPRMSRFPVTVQAVEINPSGWAVVLAHLLESTTKLGFAWARDLTAIMVVLRADPASSHSVSNIENALFRLGVKLPKIPD